MRPKAKNETAARRVRLGGTACLLAAALFAVGCSDDSGGGGSAICGDEICEEPETDITCFEDCGCGNGILNQGEECDGEEHGGETCESLGYEAGTLTCTSQCTFNTLTCQGSSCGDGVLDADEECDGEELGGETCVSLGYESGALACSDACDFDTSACVGTGCGDGVKDADEECDGDDLGGTTCTDLGFVGGALACGEECVFDTSGCESLADCGNGVVEQGEECDDGGESATCDEDCTPVECGDGVTNAAAGEECDDGGESATCDEDCTPAECGDGVVNVTAGEECDDGGESATCDEDCTPVQCGDGVVNETAGEECDDGGNVECDGCDADCFVEVCGNGVVDCNEQCDDGGETAACDIDCTPPECGDGVKNSAAGEECDDGGTADGDGCDSTCHWEPGAVAEVLLIPDSTDDRVVMFDAHSGDLLGDFIPPNTANDPYQLSTPINAVQGPSTNIFLSDQNADAVFEFQNDGTYVGVFADSTAGLGNIRGIDFEGLHLFVSDGDSSVVARFDETGARLADYVDDSSNPFDVLFLDSGEMLMANIDTPAAVRLYDAGATSYTDIHSVTFPEQISLTSTGTILVASFSDDSVTEIDLQGTVIHTAVVQSGRGCHELGNGNWLVTGSGSGVEEIDPATGDALETKATGSGWRYIEKVTVPSALIP